MNLAAIDVDELEELIVESWRLKAPKRVLQAYDDAHPPPARREVPAAGNARRPPFVS